MARIQHIEGSIYSVHFKIAGKPNEDSQIEEFDIEDGAGLTGLRSATKLSLNIGLINQHEPLDIPSPNTRNSFEPGKRYSLKVVLELIYTEANEILRDDVPQVIHLLLQFIKDTKIEVELGHKIETGPLSA